MIKNNRPLNNLKEKNSCTNNCLTLTKGKCTALTKEVIFVDKRKQHHHYLTNNMNLYTIYTMRV